MKLYWGDLHNHCGVGLKHYAKGSLERAIENARSHLDFFAFTGHSQWHDMPEMPNEAHHKWQEGFDYHAHHWPRTRELIRQANEPGRFVAFLGYEWHSGKWGDRCIIFPGDEGELRIMSELPEVEALASKYGAILYPHHIGYKARTPNGRGLDLDSLNPELSPIVEIMSEHGCSERGVGPFPYVRHGLGPRTTSNSYQACLERGYRVGVAAGSDDHAGFPGAYGEGLLGVFSPELTRESLLQGIHQRRTIASSGDRIHIDLRIGDGWIGDELSHIPSKRCVSVSVEAWDEIEMVELIKNNRVIRRYFPDEHVDDSRIWAARHLLRVEFGWGPWDAMDMPRVCDWDINVHLNSGSRILAWQPCFQSGPFDQDRRHCVHTANEHEIGVRSYTCRAGAFAETPTNAITMEVAGGASDTMTLQIREPIQREFHWPLEELVESSKIEFTGTFPCEALLIHRLVDAQRYMASFEHVDNDVSKGRDDFYYVRVRQLNGHMAWCSPIWINAAQ